MTGSGPLLGEDRPRTCVECGAPLDPDVTHVRHEPGCRAREGGNSFAYGCDCPEVCASCCTDPDCVLRDSQETR